MVELTKALDVSYNRKTMEKQKEIVLLTFKNQNTIANASELPFVSDLN